jgi:hypothetical protein
MALGYLDEALALPRRIGETRIEAGWHQDHHRYSRSIRPLVWVRRGRRVARHRVVMQTAFAWAVPEEAPGLSTLICQPDGFQYSIRAQTRRVLKGASTWISALERASWELVRMQ